MEIVAALEYLIAFFSLFSVSFFILLFLRHRNDYLKTPPGRNWQPTVSIVIPAYNEAAYIANSIRSLLTVDYPHDKLEIIVVDDGSTDDTYKIAKSFQDNVVKAFTKKNGGKGAALNFGIAKAKGELVATMDADSYLSPDVIKEMLPLFDEPDVMAVTPAVKVRASDSWLKELQRVEYLMILFSRKLLSFIDSVPVTPGPFSMFRAEVFRKVGGFDERNLVEDQEMALRIQAHNYRIRSSLTAAVYTEPPDNMGDLMRQRVRWQRGGFRNYWKYRYMIKPEYGDFGMYFIPLNFLSITAFFLLLRLMLNAIFFPPYYIRYVWLEAFGLDIGLFTFVGTFVIITSLIFLYLAVKSFKDETVKLRYFFGFLLFYWYMMICYNVLTVVKELRREPDSW